MMSLLIRQTKIRILRNRLTMIMRMSSESSPDRAKERDIDDRYVSAIAQG